MMTSRGTATARLEDELEYYSAINTKCQSIITENTNYFYFLQTQTPD